MTDHFQNTSDFCLSPRHCFIQTFTSRKHMVYSTLYVCITGSWFYRNSLKFYLWGNDKALKYINPVGHLALTSLTTHELLIISTNPKKYQSGIKMIKLLNIKLIRRTIGTI